MLIYMEVFYGQNVLQEWLEILSVSRDGVLLLNVSLQVSGQEKLVAGLEICQITIKRPLVMDIGEGVIWGASYAKK
jgi:hypothetical protein